MIFPLILHATVTAETIVYYSASATTQLLVLDTGIQL